MSIDATARKAVTLRDIARQCGVSVMAVSYALREPPRNISAATAERIRAVAEELGYDPRRHHAARRLAYSRTAQPMPNKVVGCFFPPAFQQVRYFMTIMQGILDELMPGSYSLLTHYFEQKNNNIELPTPFLSGEVDGVIMFGSPSAMYMLRDRLRAESGFGERPIAFIANPMEGCSAVVTDDISGACGATKHLLQLGHRHILHCFSNASFAHQQRLKGVKQAYRDMGLDADFFLHDGEDVHPVTPERADQMLTKALHTYPQVTAIFAQNDLAALQIAYWFAQRGISIPEQMSLVGYDDCEQLISATGQNILTTVHVPLVDMGRAAARAVVEMAGGQAEPSTIELPTHLVPRSSTAAPREGNLKGF